MHFTKQDEDELNLQENDDFLFWERISVIKKCLNH